MGDGKVVHLNNNGKVQLNDLTEVARDAQCRVNNLTESARRRGLQSRGTRKEVLRYTMGQLCNSDRQAKYHVLYNNCEHFATECLYGTGFSEQKDTVDKSGFFVKFVANVTALSVPYE